MFTISKKHWVLLGSVLFFTSLGWWGHAALYGPTNTAAKNPEDGTIAVSQTTDDFTATATYQGNQEWEYVVQGNYANQCPNHDVSVETTPATDPTTVTVRLVTYRPFDESICAQRIKPVEETGSFSAGPDIDLVFVSDEKFSSSSPTGLETETTL